MKLHINNIPQAQWPEAIKAAQDWNTWHNKPGQQKHKTIMDGKFIIHETATGTIVVNMKP
jgi:hypothetical protein